jgi:signal transduction histidine kinase
MTSAAAGPTTSPRPLTMPLAELGIAAVVLLVIETGLLSTSEAGPLWVLMLFPLLGVVYVLTGLVAWRRRPLNRMGPLITACGFTWFLVALANVESPRLVAIGQILATVPLAHVVHLLLAFPSGRLTTPINRILAAGGYLACLVLQAPLYLFSPAEPPYDILFLSDRPELVGMGHLAQAAFGLAVTVATSAVLVRRLRTATAAQRKVLVPLDVYGILTILFVPLSASILRPLHVDPILLVVVQLAILAGIPAAFALSVLRGGFARTANLEKLAEWLGTSGEARVPIERALADALGDPSLEVTYAREQVRPAPPNDGRGVVDVGVSGRRVASIHYDRNLLPDAGHVAAAGRVAVIALERARLTAELLQRSRELQESRTRIVEAEDRERRRIAQDLHDGLQAQLVLMSLKAARLAEADGAPDSVRLGASHLRVDLDAAASELRRLVHGLMPALLIERGLFAAAEDLVDLMPFETDLDVEGSDRGMPGSVETTAYFVVAEALTNVVKHARAHRASVTLHRVEGRLEILVADDGVGGARLGLGSGLRGLADRLDVLGGTLQIESVPSRGTRVLGEVPCEQ